MKKLNKILRFRFDDEIVEALKKVPCKSEYVRKTVREQLEEDNVIQKTKIPF